VRIDSKEASASFSFGDSMEDGKTILYEVYKNGKKNGEFKVLSLGIEQILRTCKTWQLNPSDYQIKRISDDEVVWDGRLDVRSST
jgi:hypothetical protein